MADARPKKLARPVDVCRDRVLGNPEAEMTLVEYGSYTSPSCHAVHEVIADLRDRFGDRMRYVFRHRPIADSGDAQRAAELAEYASETTGQFWEVHKALMKRGPTFTPDDFEQITNEFNLPASDEPHSPASRAAQRRVREDIESAQRSGALVTPTFFINDRRYQGPWDESTLADAMLGSLGHRIQAAALDFVRWGPSAGLLLLLMSVLAVVLSNSPIRPAFESWWGTPLGVQLGGGAFTLSLLDWVNHGLLSVFFLVVGLEIKREFTVGHLARLPAAALPVIAAIGGIILPALIYLLVVPPGPLKAGWGIPIATDTAFAVALIVLLGDRAPVELRVFLTAAVIIDDLVAIAVITLFYSGEIDTGYLISAGAVTGLLVALNRWSVYHPLPYAVLGVVLWICLHEAGLHATLAGVILAVVMPTRPPANLRALLAQAEIEIEQPAEIVILCAFGLNNVKLLLNSGIGQPYDPATGQGTVGRNYTYQTMASVNVFYPEGVCLNPFMGAGALGTVIDDYNGDNFDHAGLGFVGGGYVAANSTGARPIEYHPVPPGTPRWGLAWKQAVRRTIITPSTSACMAAPWRRAPII